MAVFCMKPKYLTNVPQLDEEHSQLFDIADLLRAQFMQPDNRDAVCKTFKIFEDHMRIHFENEERAMLQCDYPGHHKHREIHRNLLKQVDVMGHQLQEGSSTSVKFFNTSMAIWLAGHITSEDVKFSNFLHAHKASAEPIRKPLC